MVRCIWSKTALPPVAQRVPWSMRTLPTATTSGTAALGWPAAQAARTAAASASRGCRIAPQGGVDVLEQAHVLRGHLDLHTASADVEGASAHRDRSRRGDQVAGAVIGSLAGLELEVVEAYRHATAQGERAQLAAGEHQPSLRP